mmetsp:Transcript_28530/g.72231  ORF Transcript_28530/g.72231 Transcript_28530/m.72231 type:complete len:423 (+) Transcript_28530:177-1445(+)
MIPLALGGTSSPLSGLVVVGGDEGHLCNDGGIALSPHLHNELGASLVVRLVDVPLRDVVLEGGRHGPGSDDSDLLPLLGLDDGTLTGGGALGHKADACFLDLGLGAGNLCQDLVAAGELARRRLPPSLAHRPGQARLGGGGGVINVVSIQAQARLKTQGVARAQTRRFDVGLGAQELPEGDGLIAVDKDLKPVLPRVPAAGDEAGPPVDHHIGSVAKSHLRQVLLDKLLQHGGGHGALQGKEPPVVPLHLHGHIPSKLSKALLEMRDVLGRAPRVDDLIDVVSLVVAGLGDHRVIDDAPLVVGDEREGPLAHGEVLDVKHRARLDEGDGVLAAPAERAHVRHVEQAGLLADLLGRLDDALGVRRILVLNGHRVIGKVDKVASHLQMLVVDESPLELLGRHAAHRHGARGGAGGAQDRRRGPR